MRVVVVGCLAQNWDTESEFQVTFNLARSLLSAPWSLIILKAVIKTFKRPRLFASAYAVLHAVSCKEHV
jgi:hypothetical protein